jgi:hypothetical protein
MSLRNFDTFDWRHPGSCQVSDDFGLSQLPFPLKIIETPCQMTFLADDVSRALNIQRSGPMIQ